MKKAVSVGCPPLRVVLARVRPAAAQHDLTLQRRNNQEAGAERRAPLPVVARQQPPPQGGCRATGTMPYINNGQDPSLFRALDNRT